MIGYSPKLREYKVWDTKNNVWLYYGTYSLKSQNRLLFKSLIQEKVCALTMQITDSSTLEYSVYDKNHDIREETIRNEMEKQNKEYSYNSQLLHTTPRKQESMHLSTEKTLAEVFPHRSSRPSRFPG